MSRGSSSGRGKVAQGKPGVAIARLAWRGIAAGKTPVAYVRSQRQCCRLSDDRHRVVQYGCMIIAKSTKRQYALLIGLPHSRHIEPCTIPVASP